MKNLLLLLLFCTPVLAAPNYVVQVKHASAKYTFHGSGTLVGPEHVLTSFHNVESEDKGIITVEFANGDEVVATVEHKNKDTDLCVLKLDARRETPIPISKTPVQLLEIVTVYGFPGTSKRCRTHRGKVGELSATGESGDLIFTLLRTTIKTGVSGGPVVRKGKLVGVAWGCSENETFCTQLKHVEEILDKI